MTRRWLEPAPTGSARTTFIVLRFPTAPSSSHAAFRARMSSMGDPQSVAVIMSKQSKRAAAMWRWRIDVAMSTPCRTAERTKQLRAGGQPRRVRRGSPGFQPRTPARSTLRRPDVVTKKAVRWTTGGDQAHQMVRRGRATRTASAKCVPPQGVRKKNGYPRRRQLLGLMSRTAAKSPTR
jgi:hypothetical protein